MEYVEELNMGGSQENGSDPNELDLWDFMDEWMGEDYPDSTQLMAMIADLMGKLNVEIVDGKIKLNG